MQATPTETRARATTPRARTWAISAAAMLLNVVIAACGPPVTPEASSGDPLRLRARLMPGAFELTWEPSLGGLANGYELQYGTSTTTWTTFTESTDVSTTFDAVEPGVRFSFRIREKVGAGAAPAPWGPRIEELYVEPSLPVVHIDTEAGAPILDKENYVRSTVQIDPNGSQYSDYRGTAGIRGRGNSTWAMPKKPYRLKLDSRSPMLGLPSERDWVLLANALDPSHLRNFAATELSRLTGLAFTPTMRHVEVVLNGRYDGVYTLTEHQELGPDRIDITEMSDEDNHGTDLTGGYRLEIDRRLEENDEPGFRTPRGVPVVVKDPDPMTPQQRTYIQGEVRQLENSIYSPSFDVPAAGYRRFLDVESFIDHFLVQEVTRNSDAFVASTFFTKDRGEDRFRFGPVWDFDLSTGTTRAAISDSPIGDESRLRGWLPRLFEDPAFERQVAARWQELSPAFSTIPDVVRTKATTIQPAISSDRLRWPGWFLEPSDTPDHVADWLTARIEWMDGRYADPPS